jgi:hypothetical protein
MAQLPPNGDWLVQQIDGVVVIFHRYTEVEVVRFDPHSRDATAKAQGAIYRDTHLSDEEKSFAHFWCGYFYAHANVGEE